MNPQSLHDLFVAIRHIEQNGSEDIQYARMQSQLPPDGEATDVTLGAMNDLGPINGRHSSNEQHGTDAHA